MLARLHDRSRKSRSSVSLSRCNTVREQFAFALSTNETAPSTILGLYCEFANDRIVYIVSSVAGCTTATRMEYIRLQNTVEVSFNRARVHGTPPLEIHFDTPTEDGRLLKQGLNSTLRTRRCDDVASLRTDGYFRENYAGCRNAITVFHLNAERLILIS